MTRSSFNRGWRARPKQNTFLEGMQQGAEEWEDVTLPHDAMIGTRRDPHALDGPLNGYFPGGSFQYEKAFDVPAAWRGKRVSLEFEAVYRDARVYLDREFVGGHHSGWTGFTLPLDRFLRPGERQTLSLECSAFLDGRKYTGAGIHRDVWLHVQELVHLVPQAVHVRTPDIDEHRAIVDMATSVTNESPDVASVVVRSEVRDPDGTVVGADDYPLTVLPGGTPTVRQRVAVADPRLWSTSTPQLHTVATTLRWAGEDHEEGDLERQVTSFGIRRLQVDPRLGLRINGEPTLLRGACLHGENGPLGAATIRRADERRIEILREAGFNAVRIGHQAMSTAMLEACDRLGVLVLDEVFDSWTSSKADLDFSLYFPDHAEDEVAAMVRKDRNHPSVIMYSVGNEVPEAGRPLDSAWSRRLADVVRALDPDRFTVNCINGLAAVGPYLGAASDRAPAGDGAREGGEQESPLSGGLNTMMNDAGGLLATLVNSDLVTERTAEAFAGVDIGGYNYMEGRYDDEADRFPNRVMVGSETGRPPFPGNWQRVKTLPNLIGDFCWAGWDYLGEVGIGRPQVPGEERQLLGNYPWLAGAAGDIDITGRRLASSYWRETVFGRRQAPYLAVQRPHDGAAYEPSMWGWTDAVGSWTWDEEPGTPLHVEVYSGAESVDLTLNGRSVSSVAGGPGVGFRSTVEIPWEPGELVATASGGGARTVLRTATGPARLRATADRSAVRADDTDLSVVVVELVDAAGTVWTAHDRPVTVAVDGAGVLQALASGDPRPEVGFRETTCPTHDGRVTAYVRPTVTGTITLVATCEPGLTATVSIDASVPPSAER